MIAALLCTLTVEIAAGGATSEYGLGYAAPAAAVAASYRAEHWSVGIHALTYAGSPAYASGNVVNPHNGGLSAWAVLAQGGVHSTSGLELRAGAGLGRVVLIQCDCSESDGTTGALAPAFSLSLGFSHAITPHFRPGIELGGILFTDITHGASGGGVSQLAQSGFVAFGGHLLLTLAWDVTSF